MAKDFHDTDLAAAGLLRRIKVLRSIVYRQFVNALTVPIGR